MLAVSDGVVTEVGVSPSWGNYLRYLTSDGRVVIYAHLQGALISENESVKRGEVVALSGNTGASTGAHLHFGVYENGTSVDPLSIINKS